MACIHATMAADRLDGLMVSCLVAWCGGYGIILSTIFFVDAPRLISSDLRFRTRLSGSCEHTALAVRGSEKVISMLTVLPHHPNPDFAWWSLRCTAFLDMFLLQSNVAAWLCDAACCIFGVPSQMATLLFVVLFCHLWYGRICGPHLVRTWAASNIVRCALFCVNTLSSCAAFLWLFALRLHLCLPLYATRRLFRRGAQRILCGRMSWSRNIVGGISSMTNGLSVAT